MTITNNLKTGGTPVYHCIRLHRGDDLLLSIEELAKKENIKAAVVISSVGCVLSKNKIFVVIDV